MSTTTPTQDQAALSQGPNFVWHELYVPNLDAAKQFYSNALGLGSTVMEMGPEAKYNMLTRDGAPICGMMSTNDLQMENVPPHWAVYISVDDVDKRLEMVKQNGGTLVVPPMDVPTVGRMALIADPQGAHLWLFKSAM